MKAMTPWQDQRLTLPTEREEFGARYRDGVLEVSFKAPGGTEPTRVPITTA
jgi:hypothetical protein